MTINDLNIGDKVLFGQAIFDGLPDAMIDLVWRKTAANNTFLTTDYIARLAADMPEPENSSRDRRERGSNFFPRTNLCQWLNAEGTGWFAKAHDTDVAPDYKDRPGFLSGFAQWEKDAIVPHEVITVVPNGFRREFGIYHTMNCKVSIPAMSEIFSGADDTYCREGAVMPYFRNNSRPRMLLRTAIASSLQCIDQYGELVSRAASQRYFIIPKICIKGEVLVSDQTDSDGNHGVLPPGGNQSCINVSELYDVLAQ